MAYWITKIICHMSGDRSSWGTYLEIAHFEEVAMLVYFISFLFAQTATAPTQSPLAAAAPSTTPSPTQSASSCSQVPEFTSCQNSFQQQKIQTCDRQVDKSQAVSQATCNLKVAQQIESCYNFCTTSSSGDERKAYAATVDQQSAALAKLKAQNAPATPTVNANASDSSASGTQTQDISSGSHPNGNSSFGNDASTTLACGIVAFLTAIALV